MTEAFKVLSRQATDESIPFENGMGTQNKLDNTELLFDYVDITTELPALDDTIVRESFTVVDGKAYLAGDKLKTSWNNWGQLQFKLDQYPVKGRTFKAVLKELLEYQFDKHHEKHLDDKWSLVYGRLLLGKHPRVKFLFRGETIIGVFKEKTKVSKTIRWYENAIYKGKAVSFNKAHKTVDFRKEVRNDVYDSLHPEFTKEAELEEIIGFIDSIKGRKLSSEEQELINALASSVNTLSTTV